jgi:hypothetical protein
MKVICKEKKYPSDEWVLTIDKEYLVLEILIIKGISKYRIIPDDEGMPISSNADQFNISDNRMYSDWITYFNNKRNELWIAPARWLDEKAWKYSFWEDLCGDDDVKAKQVFSEEVEKMSIEDKMDNTEKLGNDKLNLFLKLIVTNLKENAFLAKKEYLNEQQKEKKIFNNGVLIGYYYFIELLKKQANACGFSLNDLDLNDIDPNDFLL